MPVSPRATELRAALERILGEPVQMTVDDDGVRLLAPAPDGSDHGLWQQLLDALAAADEWGSTEANGAPQLWARIREGQR